MADLVFNVAKGAAAEKVRDGASNVGVLLMRASESDALLRDRTDLANIFAQGANLEANFTNYARKTGLTATLTVDQANDRVDISIPNQTWTAAGGASNNNLVRAIVFYQDAAADASRVPLVALDFVATTDGTDLTIQFHANGFFRAS
jgi:hypothetical protein